ncbi:uncharacterized protein AMSG_02602 [Thecamonas trahens ATCC 50062]|uniref:Expansin-like EG45 domain-containing protein n=1 Tax=Thecamonas trahens ATCC 50062 TaxID=461836 RepID=A0A0L0D695_THETB|nr:hypothetical protein AMSG_02602 [Thecamonas trahens ATCC 50062]KNC47576.1 hypothetical protein AMSG_02602 [Thecamonas trahens ATCC 50062]|eukprot:XP_013759508.1 hypothetical protein AMSG_02602 [Thecamonas trahens ATCC 50062]
MKTYLCLAAAAVLAIATCALATPTPPMWGTWASQFELKEFNPQANNWMTTTGSYYYSPLASLVAYANASAEAFCGSTGIGAGTPCYQLANSDARFLYFPEAGDSDSGECCKCCTVEQGCGPLKPSWMADASFEGTVTAQGVTADKWLIAGNEDNYYYDISDSHIPLLLNNSGFQIFGFVPSSYTTLVPMSIFTVPDICQGSIDQCEGVCGRFGASN